MAGPRSHFRIPLSQIHPQHSSLGLSARFRLEKWVRFLLRWANRYRLLHENKLVARSTCLVYRPLERQRGPIRDLPLKLPFATHSSNFRQLAIVSEETTRPKGPRSSSGGRCRRAEAQSTSMTKLLDDEDSSGQTDRLPAFLQGLTVPIASLPTECASYDSPYLSEIQTWRCWHHGKLPIPCRQQHIDAAPFTWAVYVLRQRELVTYSVPT
jgi:hypothetical protein